MCPPVTFRRCATQTTWSLSVTSTFALKIACDELHDDPFNPVARAELVRPNTDEAPSQTPRSFAWRRRSGRSQCVSVSAAFDVAFRSAKHR
jgi:hypothetical protein